MPQKTDRILFITICAWCGSEKSMRYITRPDGYEKGCNDLARCLRSLQDSDNREDS